MTPNLKPVRDHVFENCRVDLDGNLFERCRLENCQLVFAGKAAFAFVACDLVGTITIVLEDRARMVMGMLAELCGDDALLSFAADLRESRPVAN